MALDTIDAAARRGVLAVQEYALLSGRAVSNIFRNPFYRSDIFIQADIIGVGSLPIVILTGFFLGGVLALQSAATLTQFGAAAFTGQLVAFSMIKEIGPVLTALMVSGRNASGMASELGSMKVTEQIDAMRALGTDPLKKLVNPASSPPSSCSSSSSSSPTPWASSAAASSPSHAGPGSQHFHTCLSVP